jgi:hypothetical protein
MAAADSDGLRLSVTTQPPATWYRDINGKGHRLDVGVRVSGLLSPICDSEVHAWLCHVYPDGRFVRVPDDAAFHVHELIALDNGTMQLRCRVARVSSTDPVKLPYAVEVEVESNGTAATVYTTSFNVKCEPPDYRKHVTAPPRAAEGPGLSGDVSASAAGTDSSCDAPPPPSTPHASGHDPHPHGRRGGCASCPLARTRMAATTMRVPAGTLAAGCKQRRTLPVRRTTLAQWTPTATPSRRSTPRATRGAAAARAPDRRPQRCREPKCLFTG